MIRFSADIVRAREFAQVDHYSGEFIEENKRTKYCIEITATCKNQEGDIDVGITFTSEMPIEKIAALSRNDRSKAAAYALASRAKELLERTGICELYRAEKIDFYDDTPLPVPDKEEFEADIQILGPLSAHFQKATRLQNDVEAAFERAKNFLNDGIDYAHGDRSRILSAKSYIVSCMRADATPMMYGWNTEKSSGISHRVEDLVSRKNANHPNYRSQAEWVKSTLYSVDCPSLWSSYPPTPNLLKID